MPQNTRFYDNTKNIRGRIKTGVQAEIAKIPDRKIVDILLQRNETSSFLKGALAYCLHESIGGTLNDAERVSLAVAIEIHLSSFMILDNVTDRHSERNGQTTYLTEYGPEMSAIA